MGVMLVHNEDEFVEQALRNVAQFCDRFHVADNMSTDGTWDAIGRVAADFDHLEPVRTRRTGDSHALVEGYAGTDTWVFGVDGDELYDPAGLAAFREQLLDGAHREWFSLKSNVLNVAELDDGGRTASGYLSPPLRSITKLFNFAAIDSWTRCYRQYMHDGEIDGPATTASRSVSSATATHGRRAHCAASTCAFCAARASIHRRRRATAG